MSLIWKLLNLAVFSFCLFMPISFILGLLALGGRASDTISTVAISTAIRLNQRTAFLTEAWWTVIAIVLSVVVLLRGLQLAILLAEHRAAHESDTHNHTAAHGVCRCGFWENGNRAAVVIMWVAMVTFPMITYTTVSDALHWVFALLTISMWTTHNWMMCIITCYERRFLYDGVCKVYFPVVCMFIPTLTATGMLFVLLVELTTAPTKEDVNWLSEWLCVFSLVLFFLPYAYLFHENPVDDELREYSRRLAHKFGCCLHRKDPIATRNHSRRQMSWRQSSYRGPGKLSDAHKAAAAAAADDTAGAAAGTAV